MIYQNENENGEFLNKNFSEYHYLSEVVKHLSSHLDDTFHLYIIHDNYSKKIHKRHNVINVAIHIGNEVEFSDKNYEYFNFIFRFYLEEECDYKKIFPINIGYNSSGKAKKFEFSSTTIIQERGNDVFFIGNKKCRPEFYNSVHKYSKIYDITFTDGFREGHNIREYRTLLGNSKICLVPSGVSPETFRYTEAFASGCIVVTTQKLKSWFYQDSPTIFINNWSDFTEQFVKSILDSDLDKLYEDNLNYYHNKLSPKANAEYIIKVLKNSENIKHPKRFGLLLVFRRRFIKRFPKLFQLKRKFLSYIRKILLRVNDRKSEFLKI
jgi:hypothetical protein